MKKLLTYIFLLCSLFAQAQANLFSAGLCHTAAPPAFNPGARGCRLAIDTTTQIFYAWKIGTTWDAIGSTIDQTIGCVPPAYTPAKWQSDWAVNGCDSLYHFRSGIWRHVNPGGGGGSIYTAGNGIDITSNVISADTSVLATVYDAVSVFRLWPQGSVNSWQTSGDKRNWIIYQNNIQPASVRNAFMRFDTINLTSTGSTTNGSGNGIWMANSGGSGDVLSGFSNHLQSGMGFNLMMSGNLTSLDWRASGIRGSVLKALNWSTGTNDATITFFRSKSFVTSTNELVPLVAGDEIGAIRFSAADTTRSLSSATLEQLDIPAPVSAVVGYTYKKQFNDAHYGGVGIYSTNGSTTQNLLFKVDSTVAVSGTNLDITGNIRMNTAGNKIFIATGANASAGTATLVAGEIVVNTTAITSNSQIKLNCKTAIVTQGHLSYSDVVNGTSFKIKSSNVADASVIEWLIIN